MKIQKNQVLTGALFLAAMAVGVSAQAAMPTPVATQKMADTPGQNLDKLQTVTEIPREKREKAYAKLMEGQRYLWLSNPSRSQTGSAANSRLARAAFQSAVELDPTLAEGYTALAELALSVPPNDVDEAISLALIAIRIEPDNFGGHRILARLYTFKSHLNASIVDRIFAAKAVTEWKEVTRLDPRNAEGWAFLSEFYLAGGNAEEQIAALKKWVASAAPVDTQFYRRVMGGRSDLTPERASMKLGTALIVAGKSEEAVEIVSNLVADDPENADAVDLLREALETGGEKAGPIALESLQQAIFASPGNVSLVTLLAQIHARAGRTDEAVKILRTAETRLAGSDRNGAASLDVLIGDLLAVADNVTDAAAAYDKALVVRGIKANAIVGDADRDFVMQVFEKMIRSYKNANRPVDVQKAITRARQLLGKDDLFTDRQMISFYRETGQKTEALAAVRAVRSRYPNDYGLLRLEASVLTESGRVDDGVALVRSLIDKKLAGGPDGDAAATPTAFDDFSSLLFISQLYSEANREKEASEAAKQALLVANGDERKQIAKLSLATAQQMSGDFAAAEATLREILKQTPGNPIALNNLGYFLLERDERIEEALDLIQRALKVDPTNPSYLDSLGWANFKLGNFAEAEKNLRYAARLDAGSGTIREHLGDVYGKQGKTELARSAWQRALDLASNAMDTNRLKAKLGQ